MARYKHYDLNQTKMIPLCYADQILPGSFEHALGEIVEQHLDLTAFDQRYRNDQTGRLAYDPKVLLKIVIYGYYKGLLSSRQLEEACQRNIIFMALSADTQPHFTTIASFVRELHREIVDLFRDVLLYASELGLIGSEHFAVDGCKLPSNASKQWSGTHTELEEKRKKLQGVAERIIQRHQDQDSAEDGGKASAGHAKKLEHYQRKMKQLETLLRDTDHKPGPTGNEHRSARGPSCHVALPRNESAITPTDSPEEPTFAAASCSTCHDAAPSHRYASHPHPTHAVIRRNPRPPSRL